MKKLHEHLQNEERFSLRQDEKARMRAAIDAAIAYNPVRGRMQARSFWYMHRTASSFVSAGLLLALMSGTAYASQGSLPGDLLYPIKIHITEPLALNTATTPAQKASVQAELATRRVQEAEQLAAQGRLTAEHAALLQSNFAAHAQEAITLVEGVSKTDKGAGAQLSTELSASLEAHTQVLAQLADAQKDASTKESSQKIIATVASETGSLAQFQLPMPQPIAVVATAAAPKEHSIARSAAVRTLSATAPAPEVAPTSDTSSPDNETDVTALKIGAETQLSEAENEISNDGIDASSSARFKEKVSSIRALIASGTASSTPKGEAGVRYQQALQEGVILRTHINAHKQFKGILDQDL